MSLAVTGTPPDDTTRPREARRDVVVRAALAVTVSVGLAAWGVGLRRCGYDYDEVLRAHSIWLSSKGLRPYHDFFECHPPYFALLTPVVRAFPDPGLALQALRVVSATGTFVFLAGLAALGASLVPDAKRWAQLGLVVVALRPEALLFLVEFRFDGWGYALAAWSLIRMIRRSRRPAHYGEFGLLSGLATVLCPKIALLPPLVVAFSPLDGCLSVRRFLASLSCYLVGVAVAGALTALYLSGLGLGYGRTFDLLFRYNTIYNTHSGLGHGLLRSLLEHPLPTLLVAGSAAAYGLFIVWGRRRPGGYPTALAVWLVAQAALVAYPHKQYFVPWYLFGAFFLAYPGRDLALGFPRAGRWLFVVACVATAASSVLTAWEWSERNEAATQTRLIRWMNKVTRPEDRVVGSPPLHPITRYDTFFVWFTTADSRGFDSLRVLERLPRYRSVVTSEHLWEELETHPPAVVVRSGDWRLVPYPRDQQVVLSEFLLRRRYREVSVGRATFFLRPDRHTQARRDLLFD